MKKKFLIISTDRFPKGNAGAIRQESICFLLKELGFDVTIISLGKSTDFQIQNYKGIKCLSFRNKKNDYINKLFTRIMFGIRTRKYIKQNNFNSILFINIPIFLIMFLKKYCQKHSIGLFHDCVEWYSSCEFKLGKLSPSYINKNLINKHLINQEINVIAISSYLQRYFNLKNINCCRIPIITNPNPMPSYKVINDRITFIYAGSMVKKDFLYQFFKAVARLDDIYKNKIKIIIIGSTEKQVLKNKNIDLTTLNKIRDLVNFKGRISNHEVKQLYKTADFSLLFRNQNQRYAKAGFPSKVVESMNEGVPVFCNYSSDLDRYLVNGYNSVCIKNYDEDEIYDALIYILKLSVEEKLNMKNRAFKTVLEHFDVNLYKDKLNKFILSYEKQKGDI